MFIIHSSADCMSICKSGKPMAMIIIDSGCLASERKAAEELSKHLHKITGADYPVISDSRNFASKESKIYVGRGKQVDLLMDRFDWGSLGRDGIVIWTVGDDLILAGGRPRGALYAVYTFLEDELGCRWWTSTVSSIPKKKNIAINKQDHVYIPKMFYRESHYKQSYDIQNPDFAVKLKLNGTMQQTPEEWGGHEFFINGGHSFSRLIPADRYFGAHPEWFSMINGTRVATGQLCLSNKDMRKEIALNVLETIAANPNYNIVDVSQNDNGSYCQCAGCTAIAEKFGGQSGLLVDFLNDIAEVVEPKHPRHTVETLAYTYTRFAPKNIKLAKNVVIRLCSIENDNSKPLDAPSNNEFYTALKDWHKITDNLFIWDYLANFANYHIPHPNTQVIARNIKLFVESGAVGMFEQGDMYNNSATFAELRNWVVSKLLWDPTLNGEKLIDVFLEGYYGKAACEMRTIMNVYSVAVLRDNYKLICYNDKNPYFKAEDYIAAFKHFNKAVAMETNSIIRQRIDVQRKGLELSLLLSQPKVRSEVFKSGIVKIDDLRAWCSAYMSWTSESDNTFISEAQPISMQYFRNGGIYRGSAGGVPENCKGLKEEDWFDFQDDGFMLAGEGTWTFREPDVKASDGRAIRMPCNHDQWATKFFLTPILDNGISTGEIFIRLRKSTQEPAAGFVSGIFDMTVYKETVSKSFPGSEISTDYKDFSLGVQTITRNGLQLWVSPINLGSSNSIYVDRVYIINEGAKKE